MIVSAVWHNEVRSRIRTSRSEEMTICNWEQVSWEEGIWAMTWKRWERAMGPSACLAEGMVQRWQLARYVQGELGRPASEDREVERGVGRDDIPGDAGRNQILERLTIHSENFGFYDLEATGGFEQRKTMIWITRYRDHFGCCLKTGNKLKGLQDCSRNRVFCFACCVFVLQGWAGWRRSAACFWTCWI